MKLKHLNFYGFIIVYGIIFLAILFKVFHVPVSTDEVPTVFFYSKFKVWDIMMFPDNWPNNHILNTLLAKLSIAVFGKEQWAIRLPNLLIFILFSFGVYRILKLVIREDSLFFIPASLLFVNPYLLDFFGLCRGYGISTTFTLLSVMLILEGYLKNRNSFIWLSVLTALLASYANFTVLVFWASAVIMAWLFFVVKHQGKIKKLLKPTLVVFLVSLVYLAIIYVPISKMQGTDQFKYWSSGGFYNDTVISLIHFWRYDSKILTAISSRFITGLIVFVFLLNIFFLTKNFRKEKFSWQSFRSPLLISLLLLVLPALINITQTILLGTPNLKGRTALFFYPLLATFIVVTFSALPELKMLPLAKSLAVAIGLLFVVNLAHRVSLKSVREWNYDQNTLEVINYLNDQYNGEPVVLKTNWIFHPSFYFYADAGKIPKIDLQPYDYNLDINTPAEYYYIFAKDYEFLAPRFEVVFKFDPDRWLLKRKRF